LKLWSVLVKNINVLCRRANVTELWLFSTSIVCFNNFSIHDKTHFVTFLFMIVFSPLASFNHQDHVFNFVVCIFSVPETCSLAVFLDT
jgi:hypothetical protein